MRVPSNFTFLRVLIGFAYLAFLVRLFPTVRVPVGTGRPSGHFTISLSSEFTAWSAYLVGVAPRQDTL